jgi:16S rRNA processing protein RimM
VGLKGEVRLQLHTDIPEERIVPGLEYSGLEIKTVRQQGGKYIASFTGFETREGAESLSGRVLEVEVDGEERSDDEFYFADLVGLEVHFEGAQIGEVVAVIPGAQNLLEVLVSVNGAKKRALIPFVREIVPEVDIERGRILITPPEGLLEL